MTAQSTDDVKQIKANRSTMTTQERSRSDIPELARASARIQPFAAQSALIAFGECFYDEPMQRWSMVIVLASCGHINLDRLVADGQEDSGSPDDGGMQIDVAAEVPVDAPGAQGWVLVQTKEALGDPLLRVDRLGAQNLIVVAAQIAPGSMITTITDNSDCNSYLRIPTAHAFCIESELEVFYAKSASSCAGADAISLASTMEIYAAVVWEVSGVRSDDPVDTAVVLTEQPDTTTPRGPRITTSTDGEFVVSIMLVDNVVSGIRPGNEFTNDWTTFGNGWAHLTDSMAAAGVYQAQWDQPIAGAYCTSAVAFKVAP